MQIGFIGGGNMATAIIAGLKHQGFNMQSIVVIDPSAEKRTQLFTQFKVHVFAELEAIKRSEIIILAVKPQQLKTVCTNLASILNHQLIISIAAGIRTVDISRWLNAYAAIIRVMPNTPAQIQAGISALFSRPEVSALHRDQARKILSAVGKTIWVDNEKEMDAITAISGSGPAYVFYMIEALEEAAIKLGLSPESARILALQTFAGASELALHSELNTSQLRAQVTSKGGTTEQGILVLESAMLKDIMANATLAAQKQSVILGDVLAS